MFVRNTRGVVANGASASGLRVNTNLAFWCLLEGRFAP